MRTEIGSISIAPAQAPEDAGRDHLLSRLREIRFAKRDELYTKYMREECPKTFGEAREWVKKGLYALQVAEEFTDDAYFSQWSFKFHWGKKIPDPETFGEASAKLDLAWDAAKDIVMVKTDEDARLKALHTFAAWKE